MKVVDNIPSISTIKSTNRRLIFDLLLSYGPLTRQNIVSKTGLSLPTVINNLDLLIAEKLVTESGNIGYTGGRKARTYDIVILAKTAIGLDITKNHISVVIINLRGDIISQTRIRQKYEDTDKYYKKLAKVVETAVTYSEIDKEKILGIGIGIPGLVTSDNKKIYYGEILKNTGLTSDIISKYLPYSSVLFNDADAACFAEIWKRQDIKNAFYIMLSNNVGGAVVINGAVYYGDDLHSGEIGHLKLVDNGRLCYCGQLGCADPYLSATVLSIHSNNILGDFFTQLEAQNKTALTLWNEYLDKLAQVANNTQMLFNCTVIIGGYVGEYLSPYLDELRRRAAKLNSFSNNADYLQLCEYKTQSIAAGAALYYINQFVKNI